jgi:hypothetical protein
VRPECVFLYYALRFYDLICLFFVTCCLLSSVRCLLSDVSSVLWLLDSVRRDWADWAHEPCFDL